MTTITDAVRELRNIGSALRLSGASVALGNDLHALADKLEAEAKAEPVAYRIPSVSSIPVYADHPFIALARKRGDKLTPLYASPFAALSDDALRAECERRGLTPPKEPTP